MPCNLIDGLDSSLRLLCMAATWRIPNFKNFLSLHSFVQSEAKFSRAEARPGKFGCVGQNLTWGPSNVIPSSDTKITGVREHFPREYFEI